MFVISIAIIITLPSGVIDDVTILDDFKMCSGFVYKQFIKFNQQQSILALRRFT